MSADDPRQDPEHASERLSDFLDGGLDAVAHARVAAHLDACAACRDELAGLAALRASARALPDRPPAADLWPAVAARTTRRARNAYVVPALAALLLAAAGLAWWAVRSPPEASVMPRYVLLLHESPSAGPPPAPDEIGAIIARYAAWRRAHAVLGEKLADEGGLLLRAGAVEPLVPAGDVVAGLFIIEAADDEQARAVAATCPHLEFGSIELRRIEDT